MTTMSGTARHSVPERVRFETLLSDTSARLVATQTNDLPAAITAALREVMMFFRADRCAILRVDTNAQTVHNTYTAYADGAPEVSTESNLLALFPWTGSRLIVDRTPVLISRLAELPPEAVVDREHYQ
jgi:hypothetical protein